MISSIIADGISAPACPTFTTPIFDPHLARTNQGGAYDAPMPMDAGDNTIHGSAGTDTLIGGFSSGFVMIYADRGSDPIFGGEDAGRVRSHRSAAFPAPL